MTEDELSYETLKILRPDLLAQIETLARIVPPGTRLAFEDEPSLLATPALRWAQKPEREQVSE